VQHKQNACKATSSTKPDEETLLDPGSGPYLKITQAFPLPIIWMYYFMDQQMLHETYWYFKKHP
jgi:hypothetical protein